jgi:calcium channel MID1
MYVDGNCRVIFDLPFCDSVAYAVPTNPTNNTLNNLTTLSNIYDSNAAALYKNFSMSLQQIPCNTTETAQYSLASNCDDCARDYKTWLCAVTIPRCVDFTTPNIPEFSFLAPRNIGQQFPGGTSPDLSQQALGSSNLSQVSLNSSRNPLIDTDIKPGPYKELLPCQELCFNMVKSCPTSMGFRCPERSALWAPLSMSYGDFDPKKILGSDGILNITGLSCNYLGVDWPTLGNSAGILGVQNAFWIVVAVAGLWLAL